MIRKLTQILPFILLFSFTVAYPQFTYKTSVVIQNGKASNRVNIAYASDGYTKDELVRFPAQVLTAVNYRNTTNTFVRPFPRYQNFFNYYRIDVESQESGLSQAPSQGAAATVVVKNALGGTKDQDRLGWVNRTLARALFSQAQTALGITMHWRNVVFNDAGYFNSGGEFTCFSFNYGKEIALHEGGHGFHSLADEYFNTGTYTGREPSQINSTADATGKKWAQWIGYKDSDPRCGTIGVFEGSSYVSQGAYRPSVNSKMGTTSDSRPVSFNAVSREKIILDIYSIIKPVDEALDTTRQLTDPDSIWVKVNDPKVLLVDWYIDGVLNKKNGGTSLKKNEIKMGLHLIRAHVYDEVVIHANSNNNTPHELDLVRKDLDKLQQNLRWNVRINEVTGIGDFAEISKAITLYPNPVESQLQINIPHQLDVDHIAILDISGRALLHSKSTQVDVSPLAQGVYIVKITAGEQIFTKIFCKK